MRAQMVPRQVVVMKKAEVEAVEVVVEATPKTLRQAVVIVKAVKVVLQRSHQLRNQKNQLGRERRLR